VLRFGLQTLLLDETDATVVNVLNGEALFGIDGVETLSALLLEHFDF
jgi:hypothetical protein